jgi:DNA-binding beta-propeller fold protein YncE
MNTLELIDTVFVGSSPRGMAVSRDGNTLYVATAGASSLAVVDLTTRTLQSSIALPTSAQDVEVDYAGRIYAAPASSSFSSVMVYNPATGAVTTPFGSASECYSAMLEISPDGKTLFVANKGLSPGTLAKYDVSGAAPVRVWSNGHGDLGSNGQDLWLTQNGKHIYYAVGGGNRITGYYDIAQIDANGMGVLGALITDAYPSEIVTSPDGKTAYAVHTSGHIDVWNAETFLKTKEYAGTGEARELFADKTGSYLLAAFPTSLRIYEAEGSTPLVDEDGDGVDDSVDNCPALSNPDQADRDTDKIGDLCDPFPDNPDNAVAQCEQERDGLQKDALQVELTTCQNKPSLFADEDKDGEYDGTDKCLNTIAGASVDDSGCSIVQFCSHLKTLAACANADWKNDEPTIKAPNDCSAVKVGKVFSSCQPFSATSLSAILNNF